VSSTRLRARFQVLPAISRRDEYFKAYEKFFNVKSATDAEASINEFERLFGSRQKAREAALGITDHIMTCMGKAIENAPTDGHRAQPAETPEVQSPAPAVAPAKK